MLVVEGTQLVQEVSSRPLVVGLMRNGAVHLYNYNSTTQRPAQFSNMVRLMANQQWATKTSLLFPTVIWPCSQSKPCRGCL